MAGPAKPKRKDASRSQRIGPRPLATSPRRLRKRPRGEVARFYEVRGEVHGLFGEKLEEAIKELGGDSLLDWDEWLLNGERVYSAVILRLRDEFRRKPSAVRLKGTQRMNPFYRLPNEWQFWIWIRFRGRTIRVPKELPVIENDDRGWFARWVESMVRRGHVSTKADAFRWMRRHGSVSPRVDDRHLHRLIKTAPEYIGIDRWRAEDRLRRLHDYLFVRSLSTDEFVAWMRGDELRRTGDRRPG